MRLVYETYRADRRRDRERIRLELGAHSEPFSLLPLQTQVFTIETTGQPVSCVVSYWNETSEEMCGVDSCGNSGNANLLARWGARPQPIVGNYDGWSVRRASYDYITNLTPPRRERTLFLGVLAGLVDFLPSAVVSAVLRCDEEPADVVSLVNDTAAANLTLSDGEMLLFKFEVVAVSGRVTCFTSGPNGNANMYMRFGLLPDIDDFDCSSILLGSDEECGLDQIPPGNIYVAVIAEAAFSDLAIACMEEDAETIVLEDGLTYTFPTTFFAGGTNLFLRYPIPFDTFKGSVSCSVEYTSGDVDLYLRWGVPPQRDSLLSLMSEGACTRRECTIRVPDEGATNLYVLAFCVGHTRNLAVTCTARCGRFLGTCTRDSDCCRGSCRSGRCRMF